MKTLLISYKFLFVIFTTLPLAMCSSDDDTVNTPEEQPTDLFTDVAVVKKIYEVNGLDTSDPRWNSKDIDEVTRLMFENGSTVREERLTKLSLFRKNITTIPSDIRRLDALKGFNIRENMVSTLPDEIGDLKNLENMSLQDNLFSSLSSKIAGLKKLDLLDVGGNQLTSIPIDILKQLPSLTHFYIYDNEVSELPVAITEINSLIFISLRSNKLSMVPKEIGNMSNLNFLVFTDNNLSTIPKEIAQLPLKILNVKDNPLLCLPQEIWDISSNQEFTLTFNGINEGDVDCSQ